MGNTNKKEKIKKIIFSWWFWVIVALVSYFIAVSIPIQWNESGFNFDRWEGINLYGTLFAYLWKISWIIAIVLIIVSIIKSIQKSKIGDYWKISFTILGIVGIIAYVIYSFAGLGIFDNSSSE